MLLKGGTNATWCWRVGFDSEKSTKFDLPRVGAVRADLLFIKSNFLISRRDNISPAFAV